MADRTIEEVRAQLLALHRETGSLATDALHLRPSWRLVFVRAPLYRLEDRVDALFTAFMNVDADLSDHASHPPSGFNAVVIASGRFGMDFGVRDSVRGLLSDTNGVLGGIRNQLDFRSSLLLSVAAIVIALTSAAVDLSSLFGGK